MTVAYTLQLAATLYCLKHEPETSQSNWSKYFPRYSLVLISDIVTYFFSLQNVESKMLLILYIK